MHDVPGQTQTGITTKGKKSTWLEATRMNLSKGQRESDSDSNLPTYNFQVILEEPMKECPSIGLRRGWKNGK